MSINTQVGASFRGTLIPYPPLGQTHLCFPHWSTQLASCVQGLSLHALGMVHPGRALTWYGRDRRAVLVFPTIMFCKKCHSVISSSLYPQYILIY